ncbi:hypothetical protein GH714_001484 [Hevea brasiliensis]|uniref:Uncharacterized protein n=1 Tax=Hevea brasiliensis TaxID=3981 RepID=A0A6A6KF97_HEVBR|nr:hypothetical protein GH714_001484 [Hevea brasiliensis]
MDFGLAKLIKRLGVEDGEEAAVGVVVVVEVVEEVIETPIIGLEKVGFAEEEAKSMSKDDIGDGIRVFLLSLSGSCWKICFCCRVVLLLAAALLLGS